jgi:hypothetical protein
MILGHTRYHVVAPYEVVMGIATPTMERYTLAKYHGLHYRLTGHVKRLLCHRTIDDTECLKDYMWATRITL